MDDNEELFVTTMSSMFDALFGGDFESAVANADAASARGDKHRVFDWDTFAKVVAENRNATFEVGLVGDWEPTSGTVWRKGQIVGGYSYLSSNWATPAYIMNDRGKVPCWIYEDEAIRRWGEVNLASLKYPQSALDILGITKSDSGSDHEAKD